MHKSGSCECSMMRIESDILMKSREADGMRYFSSFMLQDVVYSKYGRASMGQELVHSMLERMRSNSAGICVIFDIQV